MTLSCLAVPRQRTIEALLTLSIRLRQRPGARKKTESAAALRRSSLLGCIAYSVIPLLLPPNVAAMARAPPREVLESTAARRRSRSGRRSFSGPLVSAVHRGNAGRLEEGGQRRLGWGRRGRRCCVRTCAVGVPLLQLCPQLLRGRLLACVASAKPCPCPKPYTQA